MPCRIGVAAAVVVVVVAVAVVAMMTMLSPQLVSLTFSAVVHKTG